MPVTHEKDVAIIKIDNGFSLEIETYSGNSPRLEKANLRFGPEKGSVICFWFLSRTSDGKVDLRYTPETFKSVLPREAKYLYQKVFLAIERHANTIDVGFSTAHNREEYLE